MYRVALALIAVTLVVAAEAPADQKVAAPWPQWLTWVIALGAGGLAGAILTNAMTWYRSQRQPILYRVNPGFPFNQMPDTAEIRAEVVIVHPASEDPYNCKNLVVVDVEFVNRSSKDYTTFQVGVTLSGDNKAIHAEHITPDRHHVLEYRAKPTPTAPLTEVDITLKPFNRKELYVLRLYIEMGTTETSVSPIRVTTPEIGVVLTNVPSIMELLMRSAGKSQFALVYDIIRSVLKLR